MTHHASTASPAGRPTRPRDALQSFLRWLSRKPEPAPDPEAEELRRLTSEAERALEARQMAQEAYANARLRGDTRDIGRAAHDLRCATTNVVRLEVEGARRKAA